MNHRDAIRQYVGELLRQTGNCGEFSDGDSLLLSGRLDSVSTMDLVVFLEERYGLDFATRGFDRNDLDTVNDIVAMVDERLKASSG
jgi:acyl carrier protein